MKLNLADATRVFLGWAALAILPFPAPLHGAEAGLPFAEDFQSPSLLNSTDTTAQWTSSGVTLGRARGVHMVDLGLNPRDSRIGNSMATTGIADIAVRDMDGNGRMDFIIAGDGGAFAYYVDDADDLESIQPVRITPVASLKAMTFGDFDRDGNLDVAVAGDMNTVIFYRNNGNRGAFGARSQVSGLRTIALTSADMDGDGDLDLVLAERKGRNVEIHLNDGRGNFSLQENAVPTTSGANRALGVGDLNGDRNMDIVLAKAEGLNVFYLSDGNGGFRDGQFLDHAGNKTDYRDIALGDVNNDGHLDIVVGVHKAQNILYLNDGNGGFGMGSRINNSRARTTVVKLADMDGDGDLDIVEGKGNRIYLNQGGTFNTELPVGGKANTVAVGDVGGEGNLALIYGKTLADLEIARLTERQTGSPSTSRFDAGRGRVVSSKVNGGEQVPRAVFLTATTVQQEHTDIEYYLSNNGGKRWIRAHPGGNVWFPSEGNDLRWRAELKSRSPVRTTTLTRVGIEDVLQVSIDGNAFRDGGVYIATSQTTRKASTPVTIRLFNRGDRPSTITRVETIGKVFVLQGEDGKSLPQPLPAGIGIEEGESHEGIRLVFKPGQRGIHASTLTISGSEGGRALPDVKVRLRGRGLAPEINVGPVLDAIRVRVGTSKSQVVKIENKGEESLGISTPTTTNPQFSLVNPAAFPVTATAGGFVDIEFWFEPEDRGDTATTITFVSNAINGTRTRTLRGQGVAPIISVEHPGTDGSINRIQFGEVTATHISTLRHVIKNTGDLPLIVTSVTVQNPWFEVVEPAFGGAFGSFRRVPAGSTLALVVQFEPQGRATTDDALFIHSDALNNNEVSPVPVDGKGIAAEMVIHVTEARVMVADTANQMIDSGDSYHFGDVAVNTTASARVFVSNQRGDALLRFTPRLDGSESFRWREPPGGPGMVEMKAGDMTSTLVLSFAPATHGPASATLTLGDSNALEGDREVVLTGVGRGAELEVKVNGSVLAAGDFHHLGEIRMNNTTTVAVEVVNNGNANLDVEALWIEGDGYVPQDTTGTGIVPFSGISSRRFDRTFKLDEVGLVTATLTIRSNDPQTATYRATLTATGTVPVIAVRVNGGPVASDTTHHLGELRMFEITTLSVNVHNHGDADLKITEPLEVSEKYSPQDVPDIRGILRPTSGIEVMLRLMVKKTGLVTGNLVVRSDDPMTPAYMIRLASTGVRPVMTVQVDGERRESGGAPYNFGDVLIGDTTSREVVIRNDGDGPFKVNLVASGPDEAGFTVSSGSGAVSVVIDAGSSKSWTLSFEPLDVGTTVHTGTLSIAHDIPGTAQSWSLGLQGRGVEPEMVVMVGGMTLASRETINLRTPPNVAVTTDIIVWNRGSADLVVHSIGLESGRDIVESVGHYHLPGGGMTIPSDSSRRWALHFTPPDVATIYERVIRIVSNDDDASPFGLNVHGVGVGPDLVTSFRGCDAELGIHCEIHNVPAGATTSVELVISNRGNGLLTGTVRMIPGNRDYRVYRINGPELFRISLGPEEIITRTITFSPWDANVRAPRVAVSSGRRARHWRAVWVKIRTNNPGERDRVIDVWSNVVGPEMHLDIGSPSSIYTGSTETRKREHDFGDVMVGTSATVPLTIRNVGNEQLMVTASVSGAYRLLKKDGSSAKNQLITIGAGLEEPLDLRFVPPIAPAPYSETLTITSNDHDESVYEVALKGWGTAPRMVVEVAGTVRQFGEEFDFGKIRVNRTTNVVVRVTNKGDGDLRITSIGTTNTRLEFLDRRQSRVDQLRPTLEERHKEAYSVSDGRTRTISADSSSTFILNFRPNIPSSADRALLMISSNDPDHPDWSLNLTGKGSGRLLRVSLVDYFDHLTRLPEEAYSRAGEGLIVHHVEDNIIGWSAKRAYVRISSLGDIPVILPTFKPTGRSGGFFWGWGGWSQQNGPDGTWTYLRNIRFSPAHAGVNTGTLIISSDDDAFPEIRIRLTGNGISGQSWAGGAQRPAVPTFIELNSADVGAPDFVGLGYADRQSRLWLAFDEPAQILSGADARVLADGAALSGFEVLPNYTGGGVVEDIGVLHAGYRSGGVVMDLARGIVPADASVWVRYTPPSDGVSGIYDLADPPNRISSVRLFMLPRSAVLDYDGDGFPDALEARLGGNPLVADDVAGLPEVALLRTGAAGSPSAVAYSGIRADGVAAHLGVVTTGASSLAAYYLSDTFGYSGGYAENAGGYGCTGQFPSDYALPLFGGGCAVVDFNSIRAGVEHRIGWLAVNAAGYWAVAEDTASRLPEMVILRVPEFNMKRRNVFVANSAAADETVVVGAFHDGPASSQSLTVSLSNVAATDSPSSLEPDGFSVPVAGVTTDITSYAITGVHSGEAGKLWLAGDPLSSLTPDKYSLGKVTQTDVVRLADDNLPPLFGRASLYSGTTAGANERHAVVVRGTENYIALLPVVHGSAQKASAFEVSPWDGAGGKPVAANDRIIAVNAASPVADGALVRIAFTASNPPATVRNTVSLEVAASSAGADTATTVLTWPVIDSADALASIAGDNDNDGVPDVRDSYPLLNRLPIAVAGGISGYPDRSSAGADGWHHIRPLLPLHHQFVGSYATRAGLSFHTGFSGDARILARLPVATSGGQTIAAPEGQTPLAATYQPGVAIQMNYADFAASLSRDEFAAMAQKSRRDIAVVYNFRLHGVEPSVGEDTTLAGGRVGVVIPLPESLREHTNILPLHYTNGAWFGFSTDSDKPATAGFAPLQAGACPDDSGLAGSPYRTPSGALNTRKRTGDACMVLYLTDGAAADRDGNINGIVDALIGLAATAPPR